MAQYGRPIADTANTNWQKGDASTTDLWQQIDEETADDDTSTIRGPIDGSGNLYRFQLTSLLEPDTGTKTIRVRCRTTSGSKTLDVYLYSDDGTTLIQSWIGESIPNTSYTNIDLTVTNAITDYTNLHIRLRQSTETTRAIVTQVYLEIPDVPADPPIKRSINDYGRQAIHRASLY